MKSLFLSHSRRALVTGAWWCLYKPHFVLYSMHSVTSTGSNLLANIHAYRHSLAYQEQQRKKWKKKKNRLKKRKEKLLLDNCKWHWLLLLPNDFIHLLTWLCYCCLFFFLLLILYYSNSFPKNEGLLVGREIFFFFF